MLGVDASALTEMAADQRRRSRHKVFDGHDIERSGVATERGCPRQRVPKGAKHIDTNGVRLVNELHQNLAVDGIGMDVMEEE